MKRRIWRILRLTIMAESANTSGSHPLSMHGVIVKKNGEIVEVNIGEQEGDPVFCVTDLLPHLAADQNMRPLKDGLKGEELNVIIGSVPYVDEAKIKEPVKLLALQLLNERYGNYRG